MNNPAFKLSRVPNSPVSSEELLADLRDAAKALNLDTAPQKKYAAVGKYDYSTIIKRFGSWNKALEMAGLSISNEINISDERLFENLFILWQHHGRQPRRSELATLPSTISQTPYNRRFGSWAASLEAFVDYANGNNLESIDTPASKDPNRRSTGRDPSLRLRWRVLHRDRFTCVACGASPALTPGTELHVDHIVPWSKGGDTILENLQSLCSSCNLGKSNINTP
jgi:hypothetical protein